MKSLSIFVDHAANALIRIFNSNCSQTSFSVKANCSETQSSLACSFIHIYFILFSKQTLESKIRIIKLKTGNLLSNGNDKSFVLSHVTTNF